MTNVFRTPGALIPSTCLSPFGPMNDSFYAFSPPDGGWSTMTPMSHRMTAPGGVGVGVCGGGGGLVGGGGGSCGDPFGLPSALPPRQGGFVQSFSSPCAAAMTGLGGYCSMAGLTNGGGGGGVSHSPTSAPGGVGPMYPSAAPPPGVGPPPVAAYCMAPGSCESPLGAAGGGGGGQTNCGMQDISDIWRGSSIATLRKKALEHTVSAVNGMSGFR